MPPGVAPRKLQPVPLDAALHACATDIVGASEPTSGSSPAQQTEPPGGVPTGVELGGGVDGDPGPGDPGLAVDPGPGDADVPGVPASGEPPSLVERSSILPAQATSRVKAVKAVHRSA
jgi:hypothetical protein